MLTEFSGYTLANAEIDYNSSLYVAITINTSGIVQTTDSRLYFHGSC